MGAWLNLFVVLLIEIGYFLASHHITRVLGWDSINGEIFRSFLRVLTAYLDWTFLREIVIARRVNKRAMASPRILAVGSLAFLAVPVVMGNYELPLIKSYVFAFTSIFVAVKEEILFRGITLNLLDEYLGKMVSILLSSLIFTAWHVGVVDASLWNFLQVLGAGIFLGLTYWKSGSLLLVIFLHAAYDFLFALSPFVEIPGRNFLGLLFLGVAVLFAYIWAKVELSTRLSSNEACS